MYIYINIYNIHIYTCIYMYVYVYIYVYTYIHVHIAINQAPVSSCVLDLGMIEDSGLRAMALTSGAHIHADACWGLQLCLAKE